MSTSFYPRYLALVEEIERRFPVPSWKSGDFELWPLARLDLYLDMYWQDAGCAPPELHSLPLRIAGRIAMPLRNLWSSRHDLAHRVTRPRPAHTVFLGDGVTLDRVDGHYRDRFGEPVIAALQRSGQDCFLMQGGFPGRLPWHRRTYAANLVESRGFLWALVTRATLELPGHADVLDFLRANAVDAPSLGRASLERRAAMVAATAAEFERVLEVVRPSIAFVVGYFAGLGPAFVLACRRQGILSVDLQRAPQGGALHAYRWTILPAGGYATLPSVFWCWTREDAARIDEWTEKLSAPWHGAIHGGHTQLAQYLADDVLVRNLDARFAAIGNGAKFEREILVALQPIHGHRAVWDALCSRIETAPDSWRWWIRRHPASRPDQDAESGRLRALRRPNVVNEEASALPLPALLSRMSALVSLSSGAAVEAAMCGVPVYFLLDAARHAFADLIESGAAQVVGVDSILQAISGARARPPRPATGPAPPIEQSLLQLRERARAYRQVLRK